MDVHVPRAITTGLRLRGVDVVTAQEDGTTRLSDPALLERATTLGRALFTFDSDLLAEAAKRQANSRFFAGVVYIHASNVVIGTCIRDLELLCQASEAEELHNRIVYLPL
jgi:predicted nuclease of predicted toxin-antitoxin system